MHAVGSVEAVVAGQVLAGRFRVEAELGEGGMARVYRVTDLATQRPFALKLLKASIADDREAVARLRREAEVLSTIDNPAVVRIETYGQLPDGRLFLVIELLEGETLGARMRREQRLAPEALSPIVAGVAAGLGAAHRAGVVHRDLKPDNVFLCKAPDGVQVKILDFGISKVYSNEERLTRTGQVLGTPRYMAPEQLSAEPDLDARTDVYALGVILYEALAGTPPFVATTPSDLILAILHGKVTPLRVLRPELPAALESIVARAMTRHRDLRYATPVELAEAWLALVAPTKAAPRAGMATKLAGSGGLGLASVSVEPVRADPTPAPGFRIATFSELEQQPAPAGTTAPLRPVTPPAVAASALPPLGASASGPYPAGASGLASSSGPYPASPHPAAPHPALSSGSFVTDSGPHAASAASSMTSSGAWAEGSVGSMDAVVLPTSGGRWLWVALALLAGALTAGAVLALLGSRDEQSSLEAAPAAVVSTSAGSGPVASSVGSPAADTVPTPTIPANAPTTVAAAPVGDDGLAAAGEVPVGEATPPVPDEGATDRTERTNRVPPRRTTTRPRTPAPTNETNELPPAPFVSTAPDSLADARAALRSGDPRRCLAILDAASLPPSAARLRLEGDCYRESGQGREAVKSYERICELHPSYADLAAIRVEVERLGGQCR
jgi:serine/threonine-protein kinase